MICSQRVRPQRSPGPHGWPSGQPPQKHQTILSTPTTNRSSYEFTKRLYPPESARARNGGFSPRFFFGGIFPVTLDGRGRAATWSDEDRNYIAAGCRRRLVANRVRHPTASVGLAQELRREPSAILQAANKGQMIPDWAGGPVYLRTHSRTGGTDARVGVNPSVRWDVGFIICIGIEVRAV